MSERPLPNSPDAPITFVAAPKVAKDLQRTVNVRLTEEWLAAIADVKKPAESQPANQGNGPGPPPRSLAGERDRAAVGIQ